MLRKLQQLREKEEGFTIIEVLIVLAIAALILVIVLIAIPQLQRNQRNTARKNDISRIATTVNEFQANNNGSLPVNTTDLDQIIKSLGSLGQYTLSTPSTTALVAGTTTTGNLVLLTATNTNAVGTADINPLVAGQNNSNLGSVQIVKNGECMNGGAVDYTTNNRKVAVQYLTEAGSSGVQAVCQNAQ